jgi:hypothetical protein
MDLRYTDGIAGSRTMLSLKANAAALQRRLPAGWELAPYAGDGVLAEITRSQTFTKRHRGRTEVAEAFFAVADRGWIRTSLAYQQGGMVMWATADQPNPALHAGPIRRSDLHRPRTR